MARKIPKLLLNSLNKISRQRIFNFNWKIVTKDYKHRITDLKKISKVFNTRRNNNAEISLIHIKDMSLGALLYFIKYVTVSTTRYPRIGLFWKMFLYRMLREEEVLKTNFATLTIKNEVMIPAQSRGIKTTKKMFSMKPEETTPKKTKQEAQDLFKAKNKLGVDKNVNEAVKAQELVKQKNIDDAVKEKLQGRDLKAIALQETSTAHKLSGLTDEKLQGKDLKTTAQQETVKAQKLSSLKDEKLLGKELKANFQLETAKSQKLSGLKDDKLQEEQLKEITQQETAKAHLLSGFEDNMQFLKMMAQTETPKAHVVSKPKSTEKMTAVKKTVKVPELYGDTEKNIQGKELKATNQIETPKAQKLSTIKNEKLQRKELNATTQQQTPKAQKTSSEKLQENELTTNTAKAQLLSGFGDSLQYLIESTKAHELLAPDIEYEELHALESKESSGESESEKSLELPPRQKCRLSCPLPPPEFFPPEITEFQSYFQSPKVRFWSLPDQFLPNPETARKVAPPPKDLPKMKALLFDPKTLKLRFDAVDAPIKIYKDEILVEVAYSGVCGTDLFITEGKVSCGEQPIILGHEISGRAYAVGKDVDHVIPGDRVAVNPYTACYVCRYCSRGLFSGCQTKGVNHSIGISKNGGWAEFVVVKKSQVHKVPDQLELQQAVLIQPLSCVLSAMSKLKILREMDILIQGLGLQGCLWASVLHSLGHKNVIVCDKTSKRRSKFISLGTNYPLVSPEDLRAKAVDVVVDCTGSRDSIERSLNALNPNGQMCFFAKPQPVTEIRFSPYEIIQKEITIIGNSGNAFHFSEAVDMAYVMKDRYLQFDKLGVKTFKLENFKEAFELQKADKVSKIIFRLES